MIGNVYLSIAAVGIAAAAALGTVPSALLPGAEPIMTADSCQIYADSTTGKWTAYVTDNDFCTVYVRNNDTGAQTELVVDDALMLVTAVHDLYWINQDTLGVIAHVNPSTSFLSVYRMPDCNQIDSHYGTSFAWASEDYRSLYYIEPTPHFSETGPEAVRDYQEQAVFETNGEGRLSNLAVSPGGDRLAFFLTEEENDQSYIYIVELPGDATPQSQPAVQSIAWTYPAGELEWNDHTTITVDTPSGKKELHTDTP